MSENTEQQENLKEARNREKGVRFFKAVFFTLMMGAVVQLVWNYFAKSTSIEYGNTYIYLPILSYWKGLALVVLSNILLKGRKVNNYYFLGSVPKTDEEIQEYANKIELLKRQTFN